MCAFIAASLGDFMTILRCSHCLFCYRQPTRLFQPRVFQERVWLSSQQCSEQRFLQPLQATRSQGSLHSSHQRISSTLTFALATLDPFQACLSRLFCPKAALLPSQQMMAGIPVGSTVDALSLRRSYDYASSSARLAQSSMPTLRC